MIKKLDDIFTDLFADERITNERLSTFGHHHLACLIAGNPGGVFSGLITALSAALSNFDTARNTNFGKSGDRKGAFITKDLSRKAFYQWIMRNEGLVRSRFGKNSGSYIKFFPDGLTLFNRATDAEFNGAVINIVNRATEYVAELGTDFKDEATALAAAFETALDNMSAKKGGVAGSRAATAAARAALTRQLTANMLTIALHFLLEENKVVVYTDPHLLYPAKRKHKYKGKPAAGATVKAANIHYSPGKILKVKNKGAAAFSVQFHLSNNPVGEPLTLHPDDEVSKTFDQLFTNADSVFVTNLSDTLPAWYVIEIVA